MPDSQLYPRNLYLINNGEDIVVFLGFKVFNSDNSYRFSCTSNTQVTFVEKPQLKIISFRDIIHNQSPVVNQALPFCMEGHMKLCFQIKSL